MNKKYHFTEEQIKEMVELYPFLTTKEVIERTGMPKNFIAPYVLKHGIKKSPDLRKTKILTEEEHNALCFEYPHTSNKELAKKYGISKGTLESLAYRSRWKKTPHYITELMRKKSREFYFNENWRKLKNGNVKTDRSKPPHHEKVVSLLQPAFNGQPRAAITDGSKEFLQSVRENYLYNAKLLKRIDNALNYAI